MDIDLLNLILRNQMTETKTEQSTFDQIDDNVNCR